MAFEEQFVKEGRKDIGTDKQKQDQELFSGFLASGVAFPYPCCLPFALRARLSSV